MLAAFDADRAVVANAGSPGFIFKTADGGKTWKPSSTDERPGFFLDALVFWDEKRGLAVGDPIDGAFLALTTEDGGETWTPVAERTACPRRGGRGLFRREQRRPSRLTAGRWSGWEAAAGRSPASSGAPTPAKTFAAVRAPVTAGSSTRGIFGLAFRTPREGIAVGGDYKQMDFRDGIAAATHDGGGRGPSARPARRDSGRASPSSRGGRPFWPSARGKRRIARQRPDLAPLRARRLPRRRLRSRRIVRLGRGQQRQDRQIDDQLMIEGQYTSLPNSVGDLIPCRHPGTGHLVLAPRTTFKHLPNSGVTYTVPRITPNTPPETAGFRVPQRGTQYSVPI